MMRLVSTLLLFALVFAVLSPATALNPCAGFGETTIQDLDVCHTAASVINDELPYISSCPCTPIPLRFAVVHEQYRSSVKPVLIVYLDERPPKSLS
jgi:hypothetical protein